MKAVEAPGDARAEWEFLHDLVHNVTGQNGFVTIEGLFNQMAKEVSAFNGLTWASPRRHRRDGANLKWTGTFIIFSLVKIAIVVGVVQGLVAYSVLAERKISAWIQDRVGPNRTAPPFMKYIPVSDRF